MPAYVALGSNLDDPPRQIAAAFDRLAALDGCRLVARSRLYRSTPLGPQDQPEFVKSTITGRFPIYKSDEIIAVWNAKAEKQSSNAKGPQKISNLKRGHIY
jgi:7,8-dihydro-6-hydroxymethylpterin-pyrophosphokinase